MENPYKKLSKINPQREDGNRQIANDIYIALIMAKLSGAEYQAIMSIIHKTWGFNKASDKIGYSQLREITKLSKPGIVNIVKNLEAKYIIVVDRKVVKGSLPVNEYLFNKCYDTWLDKTGQPMFTTLEIEQIRKNSRVVKNSLPVKGQTGKQTKAKLVNKQKQTGKPQFTHKRNYTKETITKESKVIFNYWKEILNHPRAILDKKRVKLIKDRLEEGHTVSECKKAVDGCKASPHHMGVNDRHTVYDSVELIFKSAGNLERFIGYQETNEKKKKGRIL